MRFKIPYWQVVGIPILLIVFGTLLNQTVLIANHGKFPVMMNERQIQKFEDAAATQGAAEASGIIIIPENNKKFSIQRTYLTATRLTAQGQFMDDVHSFMGSNSHLKILSDIFNMGKEIASIGDFLISFGQLAWSYAPMAWVVLVLRKFNELK